MKHFKMASLISVMVVVGISFYSMAYGQVKLNYSNFFPCAS